MIDDADVHNYSHPEVECQWPRQTAAYRSWTERTHKTSVNVLEIYPERCVWKEKLRHSALVGHFTTDNALTDGAQPQRTRVLYISDIDLPQESTESDDQMFKEGTTAHWMRKQLGVSPLFFRCMRRPDDFGSGYFTRCDKNGKKIALDGYYTLEMAVNPSVVWFSHSLIHRQSQYVVHGCPISAQQFIAKNEPRLLLRPLAIDAFLLRGGVASCSLTVRTDWAELINNEKLDTSILTQNSLAKAVKEAHNLSRDFHRRRRDFESLQESVDHCLGVQTQLLNLASFQTDIDAESVAESLNTLRRQIKNKKISVSGYIERTSIMINLFFNVSTQMDSRTNLDIARLTTKISVFTQKDSSSMITMAAVTMFFLPGTFVSALFSMVFFDTQPDERGRPKLVTGPQWWMFLAITIPLTMAVFATWILWQRQRNKKTIDVEQIASLAEAKEDRDEGKFSPHPSRRTTMSS